MKLTRVFQNLFMQNGSSSHSEQFGAKVQTGSAIFTLDPASIQAGEAFTGNGWSDAVVGTNKQPYLEDMNGLFVLLFRQLCYLFQAGIPEWDPSTSYDVNSIVTAPGTTQIYGSLVASNQGNALPNQTNNAYWQYLSPQSVPTGQIVAYAGAVQTGYLACDGTSYPNATWPSLSSYLAGATVWRTFNGAADPGVGNFRVPDLRSLTLIGLGQGTGFSNRTLGQLLGEETHTLTTGEMPTHNHSASTSPNPATVGTATALIAGAVGGNYLPVGTAQDLSISIANAGGGAAHNNMQPSAGVQYAIKT